MTGAIAMPGDAEDQHRPLSGSRWGAGSEKDRTREARALLGGKCRHDAREMERHRQLRRLRRKGRRGQKDRGADRAIIVVIAGILVGILRRRPLRRLREPNAGRLRVRVVKRFSGSEAKSLRGAADMHIADMDVAERQRNLQQKCRKSEPRTTSSMEPNPPHNRHASVTMLHLARGTTLRALLEMWRRQHPHPARCYGLQTGLRDESLSLVLGPSVLRSSIQL